MHVCTSDHSALHLGPQPVLRMISRYNIVAYFPYGNTFQARMLEAVYMQALDSLAARFRDELYVCLNTLDRGVGVCGLCNGKYFHPYWYLEDQLKAHHYYAAFMPLLYQLRYRGHLFLRYLAHDFVSFIRTEFIRFNYDTLYMYRCGGVHSARTHVPDEYDGVYLASLFYSLQCLIRIQHNVRYNQLFRYISCDC